MEKLRGLGPNGLRTDRELSVGERLAYAVGDCGYNLMYYWVSTFLMIFYTDVFHIDAASVATLMLVVRIFDAVNDPIIGAMADRTKQKTGTYKRWIQWGSFGLGVSCIFLFWAHPEWPMMNKIIYMYVTYCIVVCFSTATNMPYGVLNGTMTTNGLERTKISTVRMFMITIGNMAVTALAVPILGAFGQNDGDPVRGYILTLLLFCVMAVPMLWTTALKTKEVVMIPKHQKKLSLAKRFKTLKSAPILFVVIGMIAYGFVYYGRAAVFPYYFTYYCNDASLLVLFGVLIGIGGLVGSLISTPMHKLFKSKCKAAMVNMFICAIAISLMFFINPITNIVGFYALALINGVCQGIHLCLQYSIIPDAIDYSYWQHGISAPGFLYTITSLGFKIGNAVATAIVAVVFSILGYVANVAQTPVVLDGINIMFTFAAAVFCILTGILFGCARLNDKRYAAIREELDEREAATAHAVEGEAIIG